MAVALVVAMNQGEASLEPLGGQRRYRQLAPGSLQATRSSKIRDMLQNKGFTFEKRLMSQAPGSTVYETLVLSAVLWKSMMDFSVEVCWVFVDLCKRCFMAASYQLSAIDELGS